ncbi:hypothetical protein THAOC_22705, partial [Thalassiosira oceanica]
GYEVLVKEAPEFVLNGPGAEVLRAKLDGDKRADAGLAALHAYQLTKYDAVALVDYGTLVLGPVDGAVDLIAGGGNAAATRGRRLSQDDGEGTNDSGRRRLVSMEDTLVGLQSANSGSFQEPSAPDVDGPINAVFSWERLPSKSDDPVAEVSVFSTYTSRNLLCLRIIGMYNRKSSFDLSGGAIRP